MTITLDQLNAASADEAARLLDGLYEHSPWIAQAALAQRPFRSLSHLKHAMAKWSRKPASRSSWRCCAPTRNWPARRW
jgi:2-oxo-4-hydroxy-4-carboxy--5-ureidoimidazoline (OHCU) decarboxylase